MSELILPKSDIMLSSCKNINTIASPLQKFDIWGFCYTRIYDDGSIIDMASKSDVLEFAYYNNLCYEEIAPDVSPNVLTNEYFLTSCADNDNVSFQILYREFGASHVLVLTKRVANYYENYWFGSNAGSKFINFCLNHFNMLQSFSHYFLKEAQPLIHRFEADKIWRILTPEIEIKSREYLEAYQSNPEFSLASEKHGAHVFYDAEHNRYYLPTKHPIYLTPREMDCLYWCVQGKSAEETGLLLGLSKRTVEVHLKNLKQKLNCYKQTDLIRKAIKLNIVSTESSF